MLTKDFFERIKNIRINKGLNQKKFCEISRLNPSFLSKVEHGKSIPSSDFLFCFYLHFNVNINWLLTGNGKMYVEEKLHNQKDILEPGKRLKKSEIY